MKRKRRGVLIDAQGFIFIDGVKLGKIVTKDGEPCLQAKDKDRRRCALRGVDTVEIAIKELSQICGNGESYYPK